MRFPRESERTRLTAALSAAEGLRSALIPLPSSQKARIWNDLHHTIESLQKRLRQLGPEGAASGDSDLGGSGSAPPKRGLP